MTLSRRSRRRELATARTYGRPPPGLVSVSGDKTRRGWTFPQMEISPIRWTKHARPTAGAGLHRHVRGRRRVESRAEMSGFLLPESGLFVSFQHSDGLRREWSQLSRPAAEVRRARKLLFPDAAEVRRARKLLFPDAAEVRRARKLPSPDAAEVRRARKLPSPDAAEVRRVRKLPSPGAAEARGTRDPCPSRSSARRACRCHSRDSVPRPRARRQGFGIKVSGYPCDTCPSPFRLPRRAAKLRG